MTQTKHNGGPAFPSNSGRMVFENGVPSQLGGEGMSLRDYFAGQYIAGVFGGQPGSHLRPERAAIDAYAVADAMIAAREGGAE